MLQASENLKRALNSDTRYITPTVRLYFNGDNEPPMILNDDSIVDLDILEELANETDNPIGNICSSELTLEILNENQMFNLTNKNSELYGKILPGVRCDVIFNVYTNIDSEKYETIKMGTYYLEDCQASSTSMSAVITAYDRLYTMYELDAPDISVQHNITIKELFKLFFNELGLVEYEDYIIDDRLSSVIKKAWLQPVSVGECIKSLSSSCACLVYVNRDNKIVVKDQLNLTSCDLVLSDNEQIYDIKNIPSYQEVRSSVELEYNIPSITGVVSEVLNITDLVIQPGVNKFDKLKFNQTPVVNVTGIQVLNGTNVFISDYEVNSNSLNLVINNNSSNEQVVTVKGYGNVITLTTSSIRKENKDLINVMGDRPMKVNSYLLQDNNVSHEYANMLLSLVTEYGSTIEIELRGNPLIEISDIIDINAPSYNVYEKVIPIRTTYNVKDGLTGNMLCVKAESRVHSDIVCISPGLFINSNR